MEGSHILSISEVSLKFRVSLRTLRFYESKGLLRPERVGMSRFYSSKDQIRLELILTGKRLGFTLNDIRDLIGASQDADAKVLPLNKSQIQSQIASLTKRREQINESLEELRGLNRRKA